MRTYRLAPGGYATARNRVLRHSAGVLAGTILFTLVLAYKMFGPTHHNLIASLVAAVVFLLISFAAIASGLRKGFQRNQESWDSFELVIGEDFVIRRKKDFPDLEIQRDEVARIRESATGLSVETKFKGRTIGIARELTDYEDAKERLSRWKPLVHEPPRGWAAPTRWIWIFPVITLALFAVCFMSKNSWIVITTGMPLLIGLSVSIWLIRRSVQLSAHTKRVSLLLSVLPLLIIIAKVIQAIQSLR
jgi:hypothetical protein